MKRSTVIALAATALAGIGVTGIAASVFAAGDWGGHRRWSAHGGGHHEMGGHRGHDTDMMAFFDADKDGRLTQDEIDTVRAGQLEKFDADGDGTLSLAEYQALWLDAMRERMVDRFQDHDADGDGRVTGAEFGRRFAEMVRYMDSNGDGVLDAEDMRRHHRGGQGADDN